MVDPRLRTRAAEQLLMHAQTLTQPRWTPLPHQVPPDGDWYGWLLLAGRGAGKTDACARYVHEHVMGPPCLPGPIPHWIGIIAPTLGDAATSCYAGPSGLRVHSPEAKMTTRQGGTIIKWPNGAEAKVFGAHSPEDIERLRSGGNRCLAWLEELAAWRYLDDTWDQ
ncbi:terminase large subunit domain-containing protein, partial [Streptomyces sp. UC1A3]